MNSKTTKKRPVTENVKNFNKAAKLVPSKNGQASAMTRGYLSCCSLNSNGTRKRQSKLETLFTTLGIDIIFLQETKGFVPDLKNYTCELSDQRLDEKGEPDRHGGGICTYARSDFKLIENWKLEGNIAQANGFVINGTMIINVYRPPRMNWYIHRDDDIKFWEALNNLPYKNLILVGDFNLPKVDVNAGISNEGQSGRRCLEFCEKHHLVNMVDSITRRLNKNTLDGTTLDWVLTNKYEYIKNVEVLDESYKTSTGSDHFPVTFNLINPSTCLEPKYIKVRKLKNANWHEYRDKLYNAKIVGETNEDKVVSLTNNIVRFFDEVAPYVIINTRQRLPHDNAKSMKMQKRINAMSKRKLSKEQKELKKKLQSELFNYREELRIEHEMKVINKKSISAIARYRKKVNTNIKKMKNKHGKIVTKPKEIVKVLYDHFQSKNVVPENTEYETCYDATENCLESIVITEKEVIEMIDMIKTDTSPGPDECTPTMLKKAKKIIAKLATPIFNDIFNESKYPLDWKVTNISPIHKKGSKMEAKNYRQIQCSNLLGKVFERIIQRRLYEHLEKGQYLPENQHSYRRFKGTLTNLTEFWSKVGKMIDDRNQIDVIFIDFSSAFDLVNHKLLVHKLSKMNVRGKFLRIIESYLQERKGRIKQHPDYSDEIEMKNGTPQGGNISALAYIAFSADIVEALKEGVDTNEAKLEISLYADDLKFSIRVRDGEEDSKKVVEKVLKNLEKWCELNFMQINASKSKVLHVRSRDYTKKKSEIDTNFHEYELNGQKIEPVEDFVDLGVTISQDLTYKKHIAKRIKMAKMKFAELRSKFYMTNMNLLKRLWQVWIEPLLYYCCPLFSGAPMGHLLPFLRFQQYYFRSAKAVKDEWMPYDCISRMDMLTTNYAHSILHKNARLDVSSIFPNIYSKRNKRMRNLVTPKYKVSISTPIADYTFAKYARCLWKRVTPEQRKEKDKMKFKKLTRENYSDGRFFVHWSKSRKKNYSSKCYDADYLQKYHTNLRNTIMYGRSVR